KAERNELVAQTAELRNERDKFATLLSEKNDRIRLLESELHGRFNMDESLAALLTVINANNWAYELFQCNQASLISKLFEWLHGLCSADQRVKRQTVDDLVRIFGILPVEQPRKADATVERAIVAALMN